ncbi:MAG: alkaline phosphatase family protein [Lysobacteraceae bacterium]|nr:MAG: alkaline phosphatase family protein [Xanthomonadaceae bacterium]
MPTHRIAALAVLLLALTGCTTTPPDTTPPSLLLISIDGLRPSDITARQMPALFAVGEAGVRAEGMRPSYPSLTFPNHYAMVTGLRPDHHGIVHNSMRDAALGEFRTSSREAVGTSGWWGGTPVWVGAERAGLRTATMFWPGSEAEIKGQRPRTWRAYDDDTRASETAGVVARWLHVPARERPRFTTLYFDQVDEASHDHGPDSPQAVAARAEVDAAIGGLLQVLRERKQLQSTNIVIVSDHGFETVPPGRSMRTTDMAPADVADAVSDGQVIGFAPRPGKTAEAERALLGRHQRYECWRKGELPARWHYGTHPRIPAIICQMDPGWDALWPAKYQWRMQHDPDASRGSHGYDPDLPQMRASFIATGPAFREQVKLPVFDNVDVYPLLMRLIGLPAAPGDGDIAPLLPALRDDAP